MTTTGKTPCKYGPVFAPYLHDWTLYGINTVQKQVRIYMAFFLCTRLMSRLWMSTAITVIYCCCYWSLQRWVYSYVPCKVVVLFKCSHLIVAIAIGHGQILKCRKCNILLATQALVHYLIYTHLHTIRYHAYIWGNACVTATTCI